MMRLAIVDPPYLGSSMKHYGDHPKAWVYDTVQGHAALISKLLAEFDGYALAMTSNNLHHLLPLMPQTARIASWVKPFHAYKKGVRPAYGWEPVIFDGGRSREAVAPLKGGKALTPKDFLIESITLKRGLTGAKPERWTLWALGLLGAKPEDEIVDLFPGSGAVQDAIDKFRETGEYDLGGNRPKVKK